MALDLARIVEYASKTGAMCDTKQREHLILTDGIVGGEGDGPLSPRPVRFGYLCFSPNIAAGDYVNCLSMGYDPGKLPIIREAFRSKKYPLSITTPFLDGVKVNGERLRVEDLQVRVNYKFLPPREWRKHL
jgi:uncharacterized protein (DUF362 family)